MLHRSSDRAADEGGAAAGVCVTAAPGAGGCSQPTNKAADASTPALMSPSSPSNTVLRCIFDPSPSRHSAPGLAAAAKEADYRCKRRAMLAQSRLRRDARSTVPEAPPSPPADRAALPPATLAPLLALFFGSGAAALIYQVV